MDSYECPFCNKVMALTDDTFTQYYSQFGDVFPPDYIDLAYPRYKFKHDTILISFFKCPSCHKTSVFIKSVGEQYPEGYNLWFYPSSNAKQFPDYIPKSIISDYEEAYKICSLSPKASATLSRRCIQGMIRDVWNVKESNLYKEIDSIKDKIDATLWKSIDALRQLGNIGAHMEKDINLIVDIDPDEAQKLLTLVEILIQEWYINPHERELLFSDIVDINSNKQDQRKPSVTE